MCLRIELRIVLISTLREHKQTAANAATVFSLTEEIISDQILNDVCQQQHNDIGSLAQ